MKSTANTSAAGQYCGRALTGVSKLSREDLHQIEAHRAKERPTSWAHLAARFGVNELDLRAMFNPVADDTPKAAPPPKPVRDDPGRAAFSPRETEFAEMWDAGVPKCTIAERMRIHLLTVDKMRHRLGLEPRTRAAKPHGWPEADAAYVLEHYINRRVSAVKVAKALGRSRNAVIGFAHRQGWTRYTITRKAAPLSALRSLPHPAHDALRSVADDLERRL